MTKRDMAVWFCKVVAIVGMFSAAFGMASDAFNWPLFGIVGLLRQVFEFGLFLFVWFFARGIGTELASEGEHGALIASSADLSSLLLRCAGLCIFFSASLFFGLILLGWTYEYFFSTRRIPPMSSRYERISLIMSFTQSIVGFLLAFTPRIRRFFRK